MEKFSKTFQSCNIITVDGGTNCPQGGDGGHGGRTRIRWKNEAATSWWVNLIERFSDEETTIKQPDSIEIVLAGDTEAETFIESLEYMTDILRRELDANKKSGK